MVCGTGSDSGKSTLVAGICRMLARRGLRVAPFKAQNMSLNSTVTATGQEISRAQASQAQAAGVEPEAAMNPILLKPSDHRNSQVIVDGRVWGTFDAASYQEAKADLWPLVLDRLASLRDRYDAVICEGAGSPAEINLLAHDITNLKLAEAAHLPALLVGDIDRGGVFASLYGTVAILPSELSSLIKGFVINKFRGDPAILAGGLEQLEGLTGRPTLGVVPWLEGVGIDAEDSMALEVCRSAGSDRFRRPSAGGDVLDVAVIRLPRISNFTDIEALSLEPAVRVRYVESAGEMGRPHLVILPGTKTTIGDLRWLAASGLAGVITALARPLHAAAGTDMTPGGGSSGSANATTILGICGGYQMLGRTVADSVEEPGGAQMEGLGLLEVVTTFEESKLTRRVWGESLGQPVVGYEIHHGRTSAISPGGPQGTWISTQYGPEGMTSPHGNVRGTSVHGLFESDTFRRAFLSEVARRSGVWWDPGEAVSFAAARQARFDVIADAVEEHLGFKAIKDLIDGARP